MAHEPKSPGSLDVRRYLTNILWSWAGVGLTILVGFFLSPFIIRRIGDTGFGLWSLTLGLVEYYWLIDIGFRSATLKYAAQYRAEGDTGKLNELLATGLVYSTFAGAVLFTASWFLAPQLGRLLSIGDPVFITLVRIIGFSWMLGLVFGRYTGFLEGFQRFDISSRLWILSTATRTAAVVALLWAGFGLIAMAWALLGSQLLAYVLGYISLRREFPEYDGRWTQASRPMLKRMARYGVKSLTILVSNRTLSQTPPFLIAYFLPVRFVTYYSVPIRLLEAAMEGIGRIGMITAPSAAEMDVKAGREALVRLGIYTNRYCLAIYLPVTVLLALYSREFMSVWIRPDFAAQSAFLLPVLLAGTTLYAGQFNSVSILSGLGRHGAYARALVAEAILSVAAMAIAVPRFGILAAGAITAALMGINRGFVCAFLTARELRVNPFRYLASIYVVPLAAAAVSGAISLWIKHQWLGGRTWRELALGAAVFCAMYGPLAFRFSMPAEHRKRLFKKLFAHF